MQPKVALAASGVQQQGSAQQIDRFDFGMKRTPTAIEQIGWDASGANLSQAAGVPKSKSPGEPGLLIGYLATGLRAGGARRPQRPK
ncbi:hypothetical protein [Bradyrhizobium sp. USDA 4353]